MENPFLWITSPKWSTASVAQVVVVLVVLVLVVVGTCVMVAPGVAEQ